MVFPFINFDAVSVDTVIIVMLISISR